jgi:tetratricopeptide (TPR) repeat protein
VLEAVAVGLLALLALLLASFPARNIDLWAHLAAGRNLAHGGQFPVVGSEVFAALRGQVSWLFDLVMYGLYSALGGPGLVAAKALLVLGLALLLLRLSRVGRYWLIPGVCTALALSALGTRLLLQPAVVSYLLLACTLRVLRPGPAGAERRPPPLVPPWPLLVLFLAWTNLDRWFILGLAVVALAWVGGLVDAAREEARPWDLVARHAPRLLASLALLAAVCLVNPLFFLQPVHFVRHVLPPELTAVFSPGSAATTPFRRGYFEVFGLTPAALAYFPLLAAGLLSFVPGWRRLPWRRLLPFAGLAALSALEARLIPFFAVAAGPVLAWNIEEALARAPGPALRGAAWQREFVARRVVAVLVGLVLVVCAWPGWLQGPPYEPRRWAVEEPKALAAGAAETRRWREEGKLPAEGRGLYLSPEAAAAFAWFCPEEKGLLDDGLAAAVRGEEGAPTDALKRLRDAGVDHVILYEPDRDRRMLLFDPNLDRRFYTLRLLLAFPDKWALLYEAGDLAVFGWCDGGRPAQAAHFDRLRLDLNRLAFHPAADQRAPRSATRPGEPRWWDAFWQPAPARTLEAGEAILHVQHAEALRPFGPPRQQVAWVVAQWSALATAAGGGAAQGAPFPTGAGLFDAPVRLAAIEPAFVVPEGSDTIPPLAQQAVEWQKQYAQRQDDAPPGPLYLAVRAARRALDKNPDDARAYLALGASYYRLLQATRERSWHKRLPDLLHLRQAQATTAFNRALALRPDFAEAHVSLYDLYLEMNYLDLARDHLRAYVKLRPDAGKGINEQLDRLEKEVQKREERYAAEAADLRLGDQALLASRKGLAGKALALLLKSDVSAFGKEGMVTELSLLLTTGRPTDVYEWTGPELEAALEPQPYHRLRAQALAASGEYERAEEECDALARVILPPPEPGQQGGGPREAMAVLIGKTVLDEQPAPSATVLELPAKILELPRRHKDRADIKNNIMHLAGVLRAEADVKVMRGVLLLEEGRVSEAKAEFEAVLRLWGDEEKANSGAGLEFGGRPVAQAYLEWLK